MMMQGERMRKYMRKNSRYAKTEKRNRHHIQPVARNGKTIPSNILEIKISRHDALHRRFGLMTLEEIRDELRFIFGIPKSVAEPELFAPKFIDRLCEMKGRTS